MLRWFFGLFGYVHKSVITVLTLENHRQYLMTVELTPEEGELMIRAVLPRIRRGGEWSPFMKHVADYDRVKQSGGLQDP